MVAYKLRSLRRPTWAKTGCNASPAISCRYGPRVSVAPCEWLLVLLFAAVSAFLLILPDTALAQAQTETMEIDAKAPSHPFPHYWERMFGSGRAILSLRDSYRRDLREVKQATGFEYVRFHAIFHDEVGLYDEDASGNPVYNFSYVDQIYDGLLQNGVRPYVELSFMPSKLASQQTLQSFWYHPVISPPKDQSRWGDLITRFAQHLVERYGIDEVSQWYFEVWNEPNIDFWAGDPKEQTYYALYDTTARALKSVNPRLRVGGPSTAQAAWVDRFIRHSVENQIPLDFVSTHVYGNDSAKDVLGTDANVSRTQMVCRAAAKVHDQVKASSRPDLPVIFSEYNASYKNGARRHRCPIHGAVALPGYDRSMRWAHRHNELLDDLRCLRRAGSGETAVPTEDSD